MEARPDFDAIVDQWFVSHIHNSPVSQDARILAHVQAAVRDLKTALRGDTASAATEGKPDTSGDGEG